MSNEELVAEIQAGEDCMGELWEQVEGLIKWKANHIMTALDLRGNPCGVEFEDLYQSGYLAMVSAVNTYDPAAGGAFSTWLMYHLKNAFAEATGYRTKSGQNEPLNNSLSLDKTVDDESDGTPFGEFVPDPKAAATMRNIEEKLWQEQLHDALVSAMSTVPEQYREILRLRYWEDLTLEDIGEQRGASKERIRQMENKGIRLLRQPQNACHLRPFYDFDFYCGAGYGAFQRSGMSIQERYLVIEEERKEREAKERKRRDDEWRRKAEESQQWIEEYQARRDQEIEAVVSRMTPEEKRTLLEKYGYA